jgi:hypothetical protein
MSKCAIEHSIIISRAVVSHFHSLSKASGTRDSK